MLNNRNLNIKESVCQRYNDETNWQVKNETNDKTNWKFWTCVCNRLMNENRPIMSSKRIVFSIMSVAPLFDHNKNDEKYNRHGGLLLIISNKVGHFKILTYIKESTSPSPKFLCWAIKNCRCDNLSSGWSCFILFNFDRQINNKENIYHGVGHECVHVDQQITDSHRIHIIRKMAKELPIECPPSTPIKLPIFPRLKASSISMKSTQ